MEALFLKASGGIEKIKPKNGKDFSLIELQKYVGGSIEMLRTNDNRWLIVNEEGRLHGLPRNKAATKLYQFNYINGDIVGNAVVCPVSMVK